MEYPTSSDNTIKKKNDAHDLIQQSKKRSSHFSVGDSDGIYQAFARNENVVLRLSSRELKAISEYAELCNESIEDLIRKAIIRDATLADGFGFSDPQYDYSVHIPEMLVTKKQKQQFLEEKYNTIRSTLGWRSIRL